MLQPNNHNIILPKYLEVVKEMYKPARNSPKEKRGASGGFLPRPLLLRLRLPNSEKRNQPKFCQNFVRIVSVSFVGILCKMGSDFFKQTPPFQICRRSCLGASPLGIGFRQEIPGVFEIRQKNSRRKSAVPKRSLDCAFGARADEERFLEIVGVSAMPLSI